MNGCQCCLTSSIDVLTTRKNLQENNTKIKFVLLSDGKDEAKGLWKRRTAGQSCVATQDVLESHLLPPEQPGCSLLIFTK